MHASAQKVIGGLTADSLLYLHDYHFVNPIRIHAKRLTRHSSFPGTLRGSLGHMPMNQISDLLHRDISANNSFINVEGTLFEKSQGCTRYTSI